MIRLKLRLTSLPFARDDLWAPLITDLAETVPELSPTITWPSTSARSTELRMTCRRGRVRSSIGAAYSSIRRTGLLGKGVRVRV